jgi:hypothetical protein
MGIKFTNNASATLAASINSTVTSISVTTGQGARFPTLMAGDYFFATLVDSSNNMEIIKVTNRVTDTMTVVRAQDGTIGRSFLANDRLELRPVAASFNALQEFPPSGTIAANTLSGAIVELDAEKAAVNSPTFTGTPAAPTAAAGTNTTQLATTAFTTTAITNERSATVAITNKTISGANNTLTVRLDQTDVINTLPVLKGGTGQTSYTNGQLLIGNTTGNTLAKATLTAGAGIGITNGAGSITISQTSYTDVQTFNNPGTWTKPTSGSMVRIQVWGGGGGGSNLDFGFGGGGGGYNERWMLLSELTASVSVTVGAGGTAGFSTSGGNGGNSSFGSYVSAFGGGGGGLFPNLGGVGPGGGGSQLSAGIRGSGFGNGGTGSPGASRFWDGGAGAVYTFGSYSAFHYPAYASVFGGGGGGTQVGGSVQPGALSVYGGAGGGPGSAGVAPGGGGGAIGASTAAAGAAGRVIVTVF